MIFNKIQEFLVSEFKGSTVRTSQALPGSIVIEYKGQWICILWNKIVYHTSKSCMYGGYCKADLADPNCLTNMVSEIKNSLAKYDI